MVIIKIIVKAKVLAVIDTVVEFHRKLIATGWLHGSGDQGATIIHRNGNILQEIHRGGIEASERNNVLSTVCHIRKNTGATVGSAVGDPRSKIDARLIGNGLRTSRSLLQSKIAIDNPGKGDSKRNQQRAESRSDALMQSARTPVATEFPDECAGLHRK